MQLARPLVISLALGLAACSANLTAGSKSGSAPPATTETARFGEDTKVIADILGCGQFRAAPPARPDDELQGASGYCVLDDGHSVTIATFARPKDQDRATSMRSGLVGMSLTAPDAVVFATGPGWWVGVDAIENGQLSLSVEAQQQYAQTFAQKLGGHVDRLNGDVR